MEGRAAPTPGNELPRIEPAAPVAVPRPPARDALWFSPVLVLAPARSNSSVATAMLGEHPELCAFPELALFRKETVEDLLSYPPGWKGPATRLRLAGVFRALAEHHDGGQNPECIASA